MMIEKDSQVGPITVHLESRNYTGAFVTIALLIAFLFVSNLYTLSKLNSTRRESREARETLGNELEGIKSQNDDLLVKNSVVTVIQSNRLKELQGELDAVTRLLDKSQIHMLSNTRNMAVSFQKQQSQLRGTMEGKLSRKADTEDLSTLAENVSAAQDDLGTTERTVDVLAKDLSVARSELGVLIARAHEQLQTLTELNEREYRSFVLMKDQMYPVGGVGLTLKKTDVQRQSFSLNLVANDQEVRNSGRNVFEPLYFYVSQSRIPYELVITSVNSDSASGYIGIPKVALPQEREPASRLGHEISEGMGEFRPSQFDRARISISSNPESQF